MSGDAQLMLMIAGMHLLGLVCAAVLILPALRDNPEMPPRPDSGSDGGWGRGPDLSPKAPDAPRGGLPLPDAEPALIRLRDHRTLSEQLPRRARRPSREPDRTPVRSH
ncbi:MAG: hypothetical protein ACRDPA_02925 [Solirubrobacteraceae bacterium]